MNVRIPLYYKIENDLKKKIMKGDYKTGDPLPSEKQLMEQYGVSRLTAREAVKRLEAERLVIKIQGKGTFVSMPRIHHRIGSLYSGGEEILLQNFAVKTKVLDIKKIFPDKKICHELELDDKEEVIAVERLRYANDIPAALIKCYIPYKYAQGIESMDLENKSLYRILEDHFQLQLHEAQEVIEAVEADARSARYLEIKPGAPVLLNQRITYLADGMPIEYEKVLYRSDIFKYYNKLIGRGEGRLI